MKPHTISGLALAIVAIAGACNSSLAQTPAASASPKASSIRGSCIDPRLIDKQTIVSDQEIRFTMRNGDVWVNKLPKSCFGLKVEDGFSWDIHGTLACSNQERITVIRTGVPCLIGAFAKQS